MSKYISSVGKKFENLLVIEEFKENGRWKVKCVCDCGSQCVKMKFHVTLGFTKSCGCRKNRTGTANHGWKGFGAISGDYWSALQVSAKKRGFLFDLTVEYGWELFLKQNSKCAISGVPIGFPTNRRKNGSLQTASLDRIDSDKGYVIGNVWWVHKDVNRMKSDFSLESYVDFCEKIAQFQKTKDFSDKWDRRFLHLAKHVSSWSKDPSTQVGAVIFDEKNRIVSMGYNGLAVGVPDVGLEDRDRKLKTIIHAEINAILFARKDLSGCTLATWPMMSCSNCSSTVIQAGIVRHIYPKVVGDKAKRWEESFRIATEQFEEARVLLQEYDMDEQKGIVEI